MTKRSPELDKALEAAEAAAKVIRRHYRASLDVHTKDDGSPVTAADVESEKVIRSILREAFPHDTFTGEETGTTVGARAAQEGGAGPSRVWLVDPIDGTKSFVRGYPLFSTQIALMQDGELILGVSSAPEFGELAWAERGGGAWLNGEPVSVSDIGEPGQAALSTGNLATLASDPQRWARLGSLVPRLHRIRGYGDFFHYHLLASGRIDAVVESDVNILDIAALSVIVVEAGGLFTDLDGAPVGLETTSVLASNPRLYPILLEALAREPARPLP